MTIAAKRPRARRRGGRRASALSMLEMKPHHTPMQVTPLASRTPCAMLVSVPAEVAEDIVEALSPLPVLKVAHVPGACERMVSTWPLVVVLGGRLTEAELAAVRATALDISAQVVVLSDHPDPAGLRLEIAAAKRAATTSRDAGHE
jgi:hypothetical protein